MVFPNLDMFQPATGELSIAACLGRFQGRHAHQDSGEEPVRSATGPGKKSQRFPSMIFPENHTENLKMTLNRWENHRTIKRGCCTAGKIIELNY